MRLLPPTLWLICMTLMVLLLAFRIVQPILPGPWHLAGWAVFAGGLAITLLAARQFNAARTNINTFRMPDHLVTSGLFAFSRNPMYLGFLVSLIGAVIGTNNAWAFLPAVFFFLVSALHYIPYEERMAESVFGAAYTDYRQRVRRWI